MFVWYWGRLREFEACQRGRSYATICRKPGVDLVRLSAAGGGGKMLTANLQRDRLSHARCLGLHPTCVQRRTHYFPLFRSEQTDLLLNAPAISRPVSPCSNNYSDSWFCFIASYFLFTHFSRALLSSVCLSLFPLRLFLYPLDLQLSVKFHPGACCAWINQSWLAFSLSAPWWLIFLVRYNLMLYPISSRAN